MADNAPRKVLLADDSEDDRFFLRTAIKLSSRLVLIGEVQDGEEAVDYLAGRGNFVDRDKFPFPDVLLLDLKMPRKTGHDVLEWLQTQSYSRLRVIVVSGSVLPEDIIKSERLGADAYLKKSPLREEQLAMISEIETICDRSNRTLQDNGGIAGNG